MSRAGYPDRGERFSAGVQFFFRPLMSGLLIPERRLLEASDVLCFQSDSVNKVISLTFKVEKDLS